MNDNAPKSPLRAARFLNAALNVIIFILVLILAIMIMGVVVMHLDPDARSSAMDALSSTGGSVPDLPVLTIWGGLGSALIAAAYIYVALVIKRIVRTTLDGNPFVDENISRLRKTWIVIALVEIFRMFVMSYISSSESGGSALEGFSIETNLSAWFLVFVIAAMAEVFRIGLEIKRDQELTV